MKYRSVGGRVPPEELLKRKMAKAASEVAQAEPFFDQRGVIRGEKAEQGGAHEGREVAAIAFATRK